MSLVCLSDWSDQCVSGEGRVPRDFGAPPKPGKSIVCCPMAEMKFNCPGCGQVIAADELWAGHQIQCPICNKELMVPQVQAAPVAGAPASAPGNSLVPQVPTSAPKLSIGSSRHQPSSPTTAGVPAFDPGQGRGKSRTLPQEREPLQKICRHRHCGFAARRGRLFCVAVHFQVSEKRPARLRRAMGAR